MGSETQGSEGKSCDSSRIDRLAYGLTGDAEPVGKGISELRVHIGKGYRVYCKQHGNELIILLCGGDKSSQKRDIKLARELVKALEKKS